MCCETFTQLHITQKYMLTLYEKLNSKAFKIQFTENHNYVVLSIWQHGSKKLPNKKADIYTILCIYESVQCRDIVLPCITGSSTYTYANLRQKFYSCCLKADAAPPYTGLCYTPGTMVFSSFYLLNIINIILSIFNNI